MFALNGELQIETTKTQIAIEGDYFESKNLVVDGGASYGPSVLQVYIDGKPKMLSLNAKEVQLLFKLLPEIENG